MNNAIKALYDIQKELYEGGVFFSKQGKNLHFKSKYLQLPDLLKTVVPMLHSKGCMLLQGSRHSDNPDIAIITTKIIHIESGDEHLNETDLPVSKLNPQEMGKAVTYGRRYGLEPLFGIPTLDDDGEGAMKREEKKSPSKPQAKDVFEVIKNATDMEVSDIKSKLKGLGITTVAQIQKTGLDAVIKMLTGGEDE
jgi:hypothetical protein